MLKQICIALTAVLVIPSLALAADPPAAQTPSSQVQTAPAQTQTPPPVPEEAKPTPKIEKMVIPAGPPAELKKLSMLEGNWTTSMHMFESPMGPESTTPGKESYGWAFNGMHLEGNHDFQMAGKSDVGRTTWGWDPERQQYQIVWVDAMNPSMYVYNGTFSDDNTLVVFTTYMMQGKAVTQKLSFAFTDSDNYTMRMDCDMSGEMKQMMEEKATRVKGASSKTTASKSTSTTKSTTTKKPGAATTTKKSG